MMYGPIAVSRLVTISLALLQVVRAGGGGPAVYISNIPTSHRVAEERAKYMLWQTIKADRSPSP
jgi:hypothetical protein